MDTTTTDTDKSNWPTLSGTLSGRLKNCLKTEKEALLQLEATNQLTEEGKKRLKKILRR